MSDSQIVVLGGGISKFDSERADGTLNDWVVEAVLEALEDAGVDIDDIEHSVTSVECDHLSKQIHIGAVLQGSIGMCPKPNVRVEGGGATGGLAMRTAFAYLKAGFCDSMIVFGAENAGRQVTTELARHIYAMSMDSEWEMMVGGYASAFYAMSIQEHMRRYGTTEEQMALVSVKNHRNAIHNPKAHMPMDITVDDVMNSRVIASPYKKLDCSLLSDGASAVVLATEDWAREHCYTWERKPTVHFVGSGCGTGFIRLGDAHAFGSELSHFPAKQAAALMAYQMAEISDPLKEIDVAEVADPYTGAELQAYEALGFCGEGESGPLMEQGVFDIGGALPCNTSGGFMGQGTAPGAMGIAQAVEILRQLRGECEPERQVKGARRGLTDIHGAMVSTAVVNIFERRD